jgi:multidrug transporter EmrE-like cation transporter
VLVAIHLLLVLFGGWYVLSEQVSVAKAVSCLLLIVSIGLMYLSE